MKFNGPNTVGSITSNKIVNNGGTANADIDVAASGRSPHIGFNILDYITGTNGTGAYNFDSNGNPIPVP